MKHRLSVLGHSFVSGFSHHLRNKGALTPYQVAVALKLQVLLDAVFFFGSRGARVTDPNFSVPITDLIRGFPSVVFLNYGTNDLAANVPPLQAAVKVFEIAKLIISQVPSVKHIMVFGAFYRAGQLECFADKVQNFNTHLYHLCAVEFQISYFSPPGFWKNKVSIWSKDGIHPNSIRGRELYCRALRSAFMTACTTIDKGEKTKRKRRKKVKSR